MELEKSLNEYLEKIEKYMKPLIVSERVDIVKEIKSEMLELLRVSLNAEETVTVFPALFFYPKAGGRRLKH